MPNNLALWVNRCKPKNTFPSSNKKTYNNFGKTTYFAPEPGVINIVTSVGFVWESREVRYILASLVALIFFLISKAVIHKI